MEATRPVRLLFVTTFVVATLQYAGSRVASEPYPGLFLPGFGGVLFEDGYTEVMRTSLLVTYDDGSTLRLRPSELLPDATVLPTVIFNQGLVRDEERALASETLEWLASRPELAQPGRSAVSATVEADLVRYSRSGEEITRQVHLRRDLPLGPRR